MNIEELKQIVANKKNALQDSKNLAYSSGDTEAYYRLEIEIEEVQKILDKLNSP